MVTWKTRASATAGTHEPQSVMCYHTLCGPCPPERLFFWGTFVMSSVTDGGRSPTREAVVGDTGGRSPPTLATSQSEQGWGGQEPLSPASGDRHSATTGGV